MGGIEAPPRSLTETCHELRGKDLSTAYMCYEGYVHRDNTVLHRDVILYTSKKSVRVTMNHA